MFEEDVGIERNLVPPMQLLVPSPDVRGGGGYWGGTHACGGIPAFDFRASTLNVLLAIIMGFDGTRRDAGQDDCAGFWC